MGSEYTSSILTRWFSTAGARWRISDEGAQRLHGMAGPHAEASDGAENCRERAERFDIIARYRIFSPRKRGCDSSRSRMDANDP
jgi:hypothetical protein